MTLGKTMTQSLSAAIGLILTFFTAVAYSQNSLDSLRCSYLEEIFGKVIDPQNATAIYFQVLKSLEKPSWKNEDRLKRLKADITDLMNERERVAYKKLQSTAEKVAFFQHFWLSRDLTPATETNERLVEHYARLAYARDKYTFFDARGYDDRGQIYVQYGPPDDYVIDAIHPSSAPLETWAYYRLGPRVTFDFIDNGYGYRLAHRFDLGIKMQNLPVSYIAAVKDLLLKRAFLSPAYNSAFADLQEIFALPLEFKITRFWELRSKINLTLNKFAIETHNIQSRLPKTTSNIFEGTSDLPFFAGFACFKEGMQSHSLVIAYGLKAADLKFTKENSTTALALTVAVKDTNLTTLAGQEDTLHLASASFGEAGELIATLQYKISSGRYFVLLDLNNPTSRQRGLKDFSVFLEDYPTGSLHLSSAVFAKKVAPVDSFISRPAFIRYNLAITPYPFSTLKRDAQMFVYLEIYDLKRDDAGETFYEVVYEIHVPEKKGFASLLASLNPFGKSGGSISVAETRRGKAAVEPTYLQLDFSQLRSGKYDLVVRVTDMLAKITKESKLDFELE